MSYKLSWPALLQKAEEDVSKAEEFYSRDDPMTEIDKVRGTEMAYYEKAEDALRKAEECLTPNSKVSPTEPIEVSRSEDEESGHPCPVCGNKLPSDPEKRSHHVSQHQAETGEFATKRTPFTAPEDIPMREEEGKCVCGHVEGYHQEDGCHAPTSYFPGAADCPCKTYQEASKGEEEAPLDAKMVKSVLTDALTDATNLVQGIESYLATIEDLDFEDIDSAIEVVNSIMTALKEAKEMGFPTPEETVEEPPEETIHMASPREYMRSLTSPTPSEPTPEKGEA
jgi:hypothetical protein